MLKLKPLLGLALLGLLCPALTAPAHAGDPEPVPTANRTRFPNFLGATGLLYTPSAYTFGNGETAGHFHANADFYGGGALAGVTERLELGLTVIDADDEPRRSFFDSGGTEFIANGKLQLVRETDVLPAFSIGVIDAFNELKQDSSWYFVASKYFTRGDTDADFALVGHLGYGDGIFDDNVFAGVEMLFNQNMGAMVEYQDDKFNFGVRGRWRGFAATVGLFDTKHFGGGVSYTLRF